MSTFHRPHPILAILAAVAASARAASTEGPPPVGTVRTVPVVSVSLAVGSTEKQSRRTVYAPPPGWYVRSHRVVTGHRKGIASYSVSTVPAGWNWKSDERAASSKSASASALLTAAHSQPIGGGQAAMSGSAAAVGRQESTSSHHVLVVDVSAEGEGLFSGGSSVELTVMAEMVYLGR